MSEKIIQEYTAEDENDIMHEFCCLVVAIAKSLNEDDFDIGFDYKGDHYDINIKINGVEGKK